MLARQFPPEPRSPHLKRAVVACLPSGAGVGGSKPGPQGAVQTPRRLPCPGPRPLPPPRIPAWLPGGLKALPSYQPGSLARGLPWCRGLRCP